MPEPELPVPPQDGQTRIETLAAWTRANGARFTPEALARVAREAGYSEAEIAAAVARGGDAALGRSTRTRAAWVLAGLYLATFVVLVIPTTMVTQTYGVGPLILATLLGLIGLVFFLRIRRGRSIPEATLAGFTSLLAVPVVLLLIVAGICVATVPPHLRGG
jgi:peptidoglycan/LPS O-acetylase OafA/YrhL